MPYAYPPIHNYTKDAKFHNKYRNKIRYTLTDKATQSFKSLTTAEQLTFKLHDPNMTQVQLESN